MSSVYENAGSPAGTITLGSALARAQEFVREVLRRWPIVAAALVLGALTGLLVNYLERPTYTGRIEYMLNEEGGGGQFGSVLSSFGIGGSSGGYSLPRIAHIAESNKILYPVLLDTVELDGERDLFVNAIVRDLGLDEEWESDDSRLAGVRATSSDLERLDSLERLLLKVVNRKLVNGSPRVIASKYDEETSILELSVTLYNEDLAYALVNALYRRLDAYYVSRSVEPQQATYDLLAYKRDSLAALLAEKEYALAQFGDSRQQLFSQTSRLRQSQLSREVQVLIVATSEISKNVELAEFNLSTTKPVLQIVDDALLPLLPVRTSIVEHLAIWIGIGLVVSVAYIVLALIAREASAAHHTAAPAAHPHA